MKNIKATDAKRIIDIACNTWAVLLAEKWGRDIVLNNDIKITDEFYTRMRHVCTTEQHVLFDEIFGVDIKPGDWCITTTEVPLGYHLHKVGEIFKVTKIRNGSVYFDAYKSVSLDRVRLATLEEVQEAMYPPIGTICFVWDNYDYNPRSVDIRKYAGNGKFSNIDENRTISWDNFEVIPSELLVKLTKNGN